jgi:hypothetical protein
MFASIIVHVLQNPNCGPDCSVGISCNYHCFLAAGVGLSTRNRSTARGRAFCSMVGHRDCFRLGLQHRVHSAGDCSRYLFGRARNCSVVRTRPSRACNRFRYRRCGMHLWSSHSFDYYARSRILSPFSATERAKLISLKRRKADSRR